MKRLLALLLALVMVFCLAACGGDKNDSGDSGDNGENTTAPTTPSDPTDPIVPGVGAGTKVGLSVADLDKLLLPLLGGEAGLDVKDLYLELGASDTDVLLALGAKLMGEEIDANLFLGESIVLSAPALLDKNYGIALGDAMDFLEGFANGMAGGITGSAVMPSIDIEAALSLLGEYYTLLIDEIKAVDGITATEADGTIMLSGSLDADDVATIAVNIIETACADDDFFALMGSLSGMSADEFKQGFLSGKPTADVLLSQLKEILSGFNIDIQIDSIMLSAGLPIEADLTVSLDLPGEGGSVAVVADVDYSLVTMECDISVKIAGVEVLSLTVGDGELALNMNMDGVTMEAKITMDDTGLTGYLKQNGVEVMSFAVNVTGTGVSGYLKQNGVEVLRFEFNITENGFNASMTSNGETISIALEVTENSIALTLNMNRSEIKLEAKASDDKLVGTLTMDGMEMGKITLAKKVEGSKTSYTLTTLSVQGTEIDFSEGGLSFYIDTDADIPAAPEYIDISTMDSDDLTALMNKFVTDNADLIEKLSGMMGGMAGGSAEGNDVVVTYPDYAA